MKITIAQLNPVVGDIAGNLGKAMEALHSSAGEADLVVFPELFLTGYPPRDLLERTGFITGVRKALDRLASLSREFPKTGIVIGAPVPSGAASGRGLYNAAVLIHSGSIAAVRPKSLLPTYDVFDEARYFDPAPEISPVPFKNQTLGITVCEDAWNDPQLWDRQQYDLDPVAELVRRGATLVINISASPFHSKKAGLRYSIIRNHAAKHRVPFLFVNQVGGNDELVFDGMSMCVDRAGDPVAVLPCFSEHVQCVDTASPAMPQGFTAPDEVSSVHSALVLGIRDYLHKCGFARAVVGLSGGIDSAVTCCLAAQALGSDNVLGVSMPSRYSSAGSVDDSRVLASNLGISFSVIPIEPVFSSFLSSLGDHFAGRPPDVTEENLQARIRGTILMALSNKFGNMLLSTGNKSEVAVGYCTMYGDMAGGLAVLSDVPKTMVYALAEHINRTDEVVPRAIIGKAPSAELRPDQKDQDSLPPYDVLDAILYHYVDGGCSGEEIIRKGFDKDTVRRIVATVDQNEYKRRQAPPGLKVTSKAFGTGRRMAIAARYEHP